MRTRTRSLQYLAILLLLAALVAPRAVAPRASAEKSEPTLASQAGPKIPPSSGIYDYRDASEGRAGKGAAARTAARRTVGRGDPPDRFLATDITECPQASLDDREPDPLDKREKDRAEDVGDSGDDTRTNQDYSCFPQNETSIAVSPSNTNNLVAGANDYRLGFGSSGFYASTDKGKSWYDGILPFPSLPTGDNLDGGGDPAIAFDRDGVAYYAEINFNRTDDTNGVFVMRSTNGGFTWTRACVPIATTPADPTSDASVCGGNGDPRQPGDGVVTFNQDRDSVVNGSVQFDDKEYIAVGPRPAGVAAQCFGPLTRRVVACNPAVVSPDRIYVTWTRFTATDSQIYVGYSDDQARSWSAPKAISGGAAFCVGGGVAATPNLCNFDQGSTPTVSPATGALYVSFFNGNTPDENQYLMVRSRDGGQTFQGPFFITPLFDQNYPRSGAATRTNPERNRPDCAARGQQNGRAVLTNSCFRVNSYGNMVVDRRGGAFADDLYVVISDNRNGTPASSNVDVFMFKSTDGGSTWIGPTRVNSDRSQLTGDRNSPTNAGDFGNDQWFPWVDISRKGDVNVVFYDRRLDESSTASEWPQSRTRPGNYLTHFWGAQCRVSTADSRQCVAPEAAVIAQPTGPVDPGADPQPGQSQATFPLRNLTISDVPSNMDYAFRAGIFIGDYNNVAVSKDGRAYGYWTDARNGRSSRNQQGRNPACEQADVVVDGYSAGNGGSARAARASDSLFLVTPCPGDE